MTDVSDDSLPEWTDDELALLRSADGDRPRSRSLPAALAAVGVGSAFVSSTAGATGVAAASAKWGVVVAISKWVAVAALGGTVVAGGVVLSKRSEPVTAPAVQTAQGSVTAPEPVAPAAVAVPVEAPAMQPDSDEAARDTTVAEPAAAPRSGAAKKPTPSQPDIRFELAALDSAMKTLRAGNAADALAALDRYDAEYARNGTLRVEATALRIEALVRAGQRAKAADLAAAFLARHPRSPYAARIRALVEAAR